MIKLPPDKEADPDLVDDMLFGPLNDFLRLERSSFDDIVWVASSSTSTQRDEIKRNGNFFEYRGFVLETYAKRRLRDFSKVAGNIFVPANLREGQLSEGISFSMDENGNTYFYQDGDMIAEIDDIYELYGSLTGPRIFEISFAIMPTKPSRSAFKRSLVKEIYERPPYLCKIRPIKDGENVGLSRGASDYYRRILIPNSPVFMAVARYLWRQDGNPV